MAKGRSAEVREAAYKRDGYRCVVCGLGGVEAHDRIAPHHWKEKLGMGGVYSRDKLENVMTLCSGFPRSCHDLAENGFLHIQDFDFDAGVLIVLTRSSLTKPWRRVKSDDLHFYREYRRRLGEKALPYLRTVNEVDGAVSLALLHVEDAIDQLAPGATFSQFMSSYGWDPNRAEDGARAARWVRERGLTWPPGVNYRKVLLVQDAEPPHPDEWKGSDDEGWSPQQLLDRAVHDSYSELRASLARMGLVTLPEKLYLIFPPSLARGVLSKGAAAMDLARLRLVRTRDAEKLKQKAGAGSVIVDAKILGGVKWDKKRKRYVDELGVAIPHEEW